MGEFGMILEYEASLQTDGFQRIEDSREARKTGEKCPERVPNEARYQAALRPDISWRCPNRLDEGIDPRFRAAVHADFQISRIGIKSIRNFSRTPNDGGNFFRKSDKSAQSVASWRSIPRIFTRLTGNWQLELGDFGVDDAFAFVDLELAAAASLVGEAFEGVDIVEIDLLDVADGGIDVARDGDVDKEQRAVFARVAGLFDIGAVDDGMGRAG